MCLASEKSSNSAASAGQSTEDSTSMSKLTVETEDSFSSLLEVAANNDVEGFKRMVERDPSVVDEVGLWLVRKRGTKQIVQEERTPLMVAATYGSLDVLKLIVSLPDVDLNRSCGPNKCTALHCATSGGAVNAVDVVKLLLSAGADPNVEDAFGKRPVDVIAVPPKLPVTKTAIEELLMNNGLMMSVSTSSGSSPVLSSSPENGSPCSPSVLLLSPTASKFIDVPMISTTERKEYPFDPSLPDIKNSVYSTDEFRMFMFKVRPCSRAYSHDWTECPFVHPGENARRRDPRKFHYSCVPCPEFRKGSCRRGDMCEYAHGVFESWLHPAQYRTRLCKDGPSCARRVCFFAHATEELRPLFSSTGSAIPSPRSASAASVMDMAAALNLFSCSPSSHSVMSPSAFSSNNPMSPTGNGMSHSSPAWPQPNVPTLHLPGSNLQSSRLRSSLSARDILPNDINSLPDFDAQQLLLNEMAYFSQPRAISDSLNRSGRSNSLTPSNLEELFASEVVNSSPRFSDQASAAANGMFSPSHKSAILNQLQQQQSMLSPINTNMFSPKNVDHSLLQASFGVPSPGRMSPRCIDPASPLSARLNVREKHLQQTRSFNSRDIGFNNSPFAGTPPPPPPLNSSWTQWGSPNGKADWSVHGELTNNVDEPDVSWVQSLVKEPSPEMQDKFGAPVSGAAASSGEVGSKARSQIDSIDPSVLGAWLEQMQLDQMVT